MSKFINIKNLFWTTYVGLLIVMLPHNAWTAQKFFNDQITGWAFAVVFELSILGFTIMLKEQIRLSSYLRKGNWLTLPYRKFKKAYLNIYTLGLLICCYISGLANFTYAVEFSQSIKAIKYYSIPISVYQITFGAALPIISILFARVLGTVNEFKPTEESEVDSKKLESAIEKLKNTIEKQDGIIEKYHDETEIHLNEIETKTDLIKMHEETIKKYAEEFEIYSKMEEGDTLEERRKAVLVKWPKMPKSGIAEIIGCSPAMITNLTKEEKSDF